MLIRAELIQLIGRQYPHLKNLHFSLLAYQNRQRLKKCQIRDQLNKDSHEIKLLKVPLVQWKPPVLAIQPRVTWNVSSRNSVSLTRTWWIATSLCLTSCHHKGNLQLILQNRTTIRITIRSLWKPLLSKWKTRCSCRERKEQTFQWYHLWRKLSLSKRDNGRQPLSILPR
jgi:hypothetical protein